MIRFRLFLVSLVTLFPTVAANMQCPVELRDQCSPCLIESNDMNCSLPGLEELTPGMYEGVKVNYLSFATSTSSPNFPMRAAEFEACTGAKIVFSEAANVWEDPVRDLGTKTSRGSEVFDAYFMSYSHFPEVSSLGLAEHLNERIRNDNGRLKWEDVLPKVRSMGEYRKDGVTNLDFLMYDGDFFVPIIRLDLLEKFNLTLPNTWDEVAEYAKFFNGTDLNDDGDPNDYGFCHFPRLGAGFWDWWWPEALYSTWATFDQTQGINEGFFFDQDTMEPQTGSGFQRSAEIWKDLWTNGADGCITSNFVDGRCAIGFAPPGCWKGVFLSEDGVSRKDEEGNIVWRPTMKSGEYAEPYRFRPFGSTDVLDRSTGRFVDCTPELCPKAEKVPARGHHGENDRASVLLPSPLTGRLVNRAPFYWSGGLGTLIRKSTSDIKKDLVWDFFVYTNSPETSVYDVANYASWLDSWRYSQLEPGENFLSAGWSTNAYSEHAAVMKWALSNDVNGAFNLRIPGLAKYTRDVVGDRMSKFIEGKLSVESLATEVASEWRAITSQEGTLDQLKIYRAALGLDAQSEVDLCRIHRELMDARDPSVCVKYDPASPRVLLSSLVPALVVAVAVVCFIVIERKRRRSDNVWKIKLSELHFDSEPKVLGRGTFGMVVLAEYRGTQVAVKRVIPPRDQVVTPQQDASQEPEMSTIFSATPGTEQSGFFQGDPEQAVDNSARLIESPDTLGQFHSSSGSQRRLSSRNLMNSSGKNPKLLRAQSSGSLGGGLSFLDNFTYRDEYDKMKAEFIEEMRYLAKLRHPCVTTVMGAIISQKEEPMLVMELMDNGSLYDILHNESFPLDGDLVLPILQDISQGVRFLHAATPQVIHGDLKAANVLVDSRFRAKVADFGLSAKRNVGVCGTPFWMAPELLRGESNNSAASDVYSFGIILYEVYSRKDPYFNEDDGDRVLRLIANKKVNKRPPVPKGCPKPVAPIMIECIEADPSIRPSFEELDMRFKRFDADKVEPGDSFMNKKKQASRNEDLLFKVFPKHVAEGLRDGIQVPPDVKENACVYFSDIVGFTTLSTTLSAEKVTDMLDRLCLDFDELAAKHDIFKIDTIGDAYMCATNLATNQDSDFVKRIADFAIEAMKAAGETLIDPENEKLGYVRIRAGFHCGPVVGRVVGSTVPKYSVFGDTVNTASRMESNSLPGRIQCSDVAGKLLMQQAPEIPILSRGSIEIKGKGQMTTYFIEVN